MLMQVCGFVVLRPKMASPISPDLENLSIFMKSSLLGRGGPLFLVKH